MNDPRSRLNTAHGYFELGMYQAAYDELDELPAGLKTSREVLELRVCILLEMGSWELAREVSLFLRQAEPRISQFVIWEAYATRRISGVEAAQKILMDAKEAHSSEPILFFNLACYSAQLGNLEEAKKNLSRSIELDNDVRQMVLDEPDLEPLWESWAS